MLSSCLCSSFYFSFSFRKLKNEKNEIEKLTQYTSRILVVVEVLLVVVVVVVVVVLVVDTVGPNNKSGRRLEDKRVH